MSTVRPNAARVPQGSILGPLLYTLFTVDLPPILTAVLATFVDNMAILASFANYSAAVTDFQSALNAVSS